MSNKRDQKTYDLFQQYRFTFALFVIVQIAGNLEAPYSLKLLVSHLNGLQMMINYSFIWTRPRLS